MTRDEIILPGIPKNDPPRIRTPKLVSQKVNLGTEENPVKKEIHIGEYVDKVPYTIDTVNNLSFKDYKTLGKTEQIKKLKRYKKAMVLCLKQKGLDFSGKPLAQVANAFYKNIVVPSKSVYVDKGIDLDNMYEDNLNSTALDGILGGITGYVKNVADKEQNLGSEGLTKFEKFVANKFNIVKNKGAEIGEEEVSKKVGEFMLGTGKIILLGIVGLLIYFIAKK